jgi:hypothetical protein
MAELRGQLVGASMLDALIGEGAGCSIQGKSQA